MADRISNSFEGGMAKDLSKELRESNVYAHSINGRLIYNTDGSLSWENAKGHKNSITGFDTKYLPIGRANFDDMVVLLSTDGTNSEIGVLEFSPDGSAAYSSIFNDNTDPSSFNFSKDHPIQAVGFFENDDMYRVYWTDNFNEPRAATFAKTTFGYEIVSASVFQMGMTPDWSMGTFRFILQGNGALRTGVYQYSYRMVSIDGYKTPWFPVGTPIVVTSDHPFASPSDYIDYDMSTSDEVSPKSNLLKLEEYDTRYSTIEFAYLHTIVNSGVKEASIFKVQDVDPSGAPVYIEHKITDGIPITVEELTDRKDFISRAKVINVKDDRLWLGNLDTTPVLEIPDAVFANLQVRPVVKAYREDTHHTTLGEDLLELRTPFYYQGRSKSIYYKNAYQKANGDYVQIKNEIDNPVDGQSYFDYPTYKGTYMSHDRVGYFRDEKYRFGITFFDKKGNPFFTVHLADVKFPPQNGDYNNGAGDKWSMGSPSLNESIRNEDLAGQTKTPDGVVDCLFSANRIKNDGTTQDVGFVNYNREDFTLMSGYTGRRKPTERVVEGAGGVQSTEDIVDPLGFRSHLRILGVKFSGIDVGVMIPEADRPLKDLISGFSITRVNREGDDRVVRNQGLLFQAARAEDDNEFVRPHPGIGQYFLDPASNGGKRNLFVHRLRNDSDMTKPHKAIPEEEIFTYDAPDYGVDTENVVPTGSEMKYVASVRHKRDIDGDFTPVDFDPNSGGLGTPIPMVDTYKQPFVWHRSHWVLKCTETLNTRSYDSGSFGTDTRFNSYNPGTDDGVWRRYGESSKVRRSAVYTAKQVISSFAKGKDFNAALYMCYHTDITDPYDQFYAGTASVLKNTNINEVNQMQALNSQGSVATDYYARWHGTERIDNLDPGRAFLQAWSAQASQVLFMDRKYHSALGEGGTPGDHFAFNVYNYTRPNEGQYGGLNIESLEHNIFSTTNHFQPINETHLTNVNKGGGVYEFDEIEVWGGDCYALTHHYMRLYPNVLNDDDTDNISCDVVPENLGWSKQDHPDYSLVICHPVESNYNLALRLSNFDAFPTSANVGAYPGKQIGSDSPSGGEAKYKNGLFEYTNNPSFCIGRRETTNLNSSLLYDDKVMPFSTLPSNFINTFHFPSRWAWSNEKKPYGEATDRFRQFEELSNRDLDATNGAINGSALLFDEIYSFQNSAFGRLRVKDRAVVGAQQLGQLLLGEGGIMDGIDYISKVYGTQHRDSVVTTHSNIYWVDANMRKIARFGQDGMNLISDTEGIHSFIEPYLQQVEDLESPAGLGGISAMVDYEHNDILFTIKMHSSVNTKEFEQGIINGARLKPLGTRGTEGLGGISEFYNFDPATENRSLTLTYNENVGSFNTEFTFYPTMYFNHGKHSFSIQQIGTGHNSAMWQHNVGRNGYFHGRMYYSVLDYVVNKYPNVIKKFDNNLLNMNKGGANILQWARYTTEDQVHIVDVLSESVNAQGGYGVDRRAKFRHGLYRFPVRERGKKDRLTGKTLEAVLYVLNDGEETCRITSVDNLVRFQNRI